MNMKTETNNIQPDLTKICRLCLTENAGTILLFESKENANIPLQIMACAAIEVHFSDSLPKQICRDCRIQLERSYYFRKRSQISDAKLRKHIRLLNAGKISKVFKAKNEEDEDDDDDDDELKDSLNFLKKIEQEEEAKQLEKNAELEEQLRQKFREEEMDRIFNEAKNFFCNKISNKTKKLNIVQETKSIMPSTSKASEEETIIEEPDNPVFENVVDSTEISYPENSNPENSNSENSNSESSSSENSKLDNINERSCYVVKVADGNETDYEVHEEEVNDQQIERIQFRVVKLEVDKSESMNFDALDFEQLENNSTEMEVESADEYNEDHVSMIEEGSADSNQHLYTITGISNPDHDLNNPNEEIVIGLAEVDGNNETNESLEDDMEVIKNDEYLEMNEFVLKEENNKRQPVLFEVNNPQSIEELKVFKCPDCPQAFTRRAQLIRHGANHERERRFQCEHCKKLFACKSSLDRHRRIHSGEKPFECEYCHRRFIQKEILKRHMYIHTGARPYKCPHCNKSFVQRQMLAQHINLKHTENPIVQMHECYLCPKSFCHASGLSRHLLTHSGVTYTCTKCGKKFSDKSAVKRHMSSVH